MNGELVEKDVFMEVVFEIWEKFMEVGWWEMGLFGEEVEGVVLKFFYFCFMIIFVWYIFFKFGIWDVVMECGIGGEYDVINVLFLEVVLVVVIV